RGAAACGGGHPNPERGIPEQEIQGRREILPVVRPGQYCGLPTDEFGHRTNIAGYYREPAGECFSVDDPVSLVARGQDEEVGRREGGTERCVVHASGYDDRALRCCFDSVTDQDSVIGVSVCLPDQLEDRALTLAKRPRFDQGQYPLALYPLRNA